MKRIYLLWVLAFVAALAMTFGLACGDDDDDDDDNDDFGDDDSGDDDAGDDDTGDDDAGDDDTGDDDSGDEFWTEDFEDMTPGPLPAPWVVFTNNCTIEVVALDAGSGNVLQIDDSSATGGDGGYAVIDLSDYSEISSAFSFDYDMAMPSGNSIGFAGVQYDATYGYVPEFYIDYEETALTSLGAPGEGYVTCATFDPATWHTITVVVDPVGQGYTVLLDGATTSCTAIGFLYGDNPFVGFGFYGYDGESWYGLGQIDHLAATVAAR